MNGGIVRINRGGNVNIMLDKKGNITVGYRGGICEYFNIFITLEGSFFD